MVLTLVSSIIDKLYEIVVYTFDSANEVSTAKCELGLGEPESS